MAEKEIKSKDKTELEKKIEQSKQGSSDKVKEKKSTAKGTDAFKKAIMDNLRLECKTDKLLFDRIKNNKNKNIDDCITYIFNQVKKSGMIGYADDEIYQLARHYYDEDEIEVGSPVTAGEVIVNKSIQLTPQEIADAKEKAIRELIVEEKKRMQKKDNNATTTATKTEDKTLGEQSSLF
jgi:hypothetical protein